MLPFPSLRRGTSSHVSSKDVLREPIQLFRAEIAMLVEKKLRW